MARKCLFDAICEETGRYEENCPVVKHPLVYRAREVSIDCAVWRSFVESDKERRLRYAEEARLRDENAGS